MNLLLKAKLIFICIISVFSIELEAQDTLVLIDREPKLISAYRIENDQVLPLMDENTILSRELRNMKELLIESSAEM
jgi:hypothetical protein